MKIYIAGAGGMLGEAFYSVFGQDHEIECSDIHETDRWLKKLDFRDRDAYHAAVRSFRPDYLFHIGAHTDLEYCERNPDDAYLTNALSAENAVMIANALDIPVLYISTAGIFDGLKATYDDWDVPNPICHYARSKFAGELYVREHARRYLICRAGWMMGGGLRKDKKFVAKVIRQILSGAKEIKVVTDKLGTPTYTYDFAQNTKVLIEREHEGVFNMVCNGQASRFDVAQEIISAIGRSDTIRVVPVSSDYFAAEYFAPRPASEILLSEKLRLRNLYTMRDWRTCLREYLAEGFEFLSN